MLKIYGVYRSRAARNIWLANELGVPFELVPVMQAYRMADPLAPGAPLNTQSPAFLKINPSGQIPSIVDGDLVLHESLAINLYIAKKYGGSLAPATLAEDAQMMQWTLWAVTAAEPHTLNVLMHRVSKPVAERDPKLAAAAVEALRTPFAVLDRALAATGHLVGNRFTDADLNVVEVMRYALAAPELFDAAPHVKNWITTCRNRPACQAMWAARELEPV